MLFDYFHNSIYTKCLSSETFLATNLKYVCRLQNFENCIEDNGIGWSELFDPPLVTADQKHYLIRLPLTKDKNNAFRQIALISISVSIETTSRLTFSSSLMEYHIKAIEQTIEDNS